MKYFQYRFADGWDKLGILSGIILGIVQAGIMQSSPVILGESINRYVDIVKQNQSKITSGSEMKAALKLKLLNVRLKLMLMILS